MKTTLALLAVAGLASIASADETINAVMTGSAPLGAPANLGSAENLPRYSNITTFLGNGFSNGGAAGGITRMVADDISRTGADGEAVTEFTFSVANFNTSVVSARPRVRFYAADGPGGAPGTVLGGYSFNPIAFAAGNVGLFTASALVNGPVLPLNFWAGITFDNLGTNATDSQLSLLGQGLFNPPTQGSSADTMFITTAAGSFLANNPAGAQSNFAGGPVANFGWKINTAPTPGALAVMGLGGLAAGRRRRK